MFRHAHRQAIGFARWVLIIPLLSTIPQHALFAAQPEPIPWDLQSLSKVPTSRPAPEFQADGLTALFYDGLPWKNKPTRVFAWYGKPEIKAGEKVPAMVLVHGGGGTAFEEWVRLWTRRGYAAIAMDTCGSTGRQGKRERHEFGGPEGWGGFDQIDGPVEDQWSYHAVADVILAHSLIRSFPEIDAKRIGLTGISWGGYLTCIVAGVDHRFCFAVPVYGCGFLGDNSIWLDEFKAMGKERAAKWLKLWDPSRYLRQIDAPLLWVTGSNDFAYPLDSLQKSYRCVSKPTTLCVRIRMPHGHGGLGENPEEIRVFADSLLKGEPSLARITGQGRQGQEAWAMFKAPVPIASGELCFTRDRGKWQDRKWETAAATLDSTAGRVAAALPEGTTAYYFNLADERGCVVSSEHEELPPS